MWLLRRFCEASLEEIGNGSLLLQHGKREYGLEPACYLLDECSGWGGSGGGERALVSFCCGGVVFLNGGLQSFLVCSYNEAETFCKCGFFLREKKSFLYSSYGYIPVSGNLVC